MAAGKSKSFPVHLVNWINGKSHSCTKAGAFGGSKFHTEQKKLKEEQRHNKM